MHVGISYGDPTGGLHGAVAVLAALLHRARTGEGQYIDLSQWETTMAVLPEAIVELHDERRGAAARRQPRPAHGAARRLPRRRRGPLARDRGRGRRRVAPLRARHRPAGAGRRPALRDARRPQARTRTSSRSWSPPGPCSTTPRRDGGRLQAAGIAAVRRRDEPRPGRGRAPRGARLLRRRSSIPRSARAMHLGVPVADVGERQPRASRRRPASAQTPTQVLRDVCGYCAPTRSTRCATAGVARLRRLDARSRPRAARRAASGSRRAAAPAAAAGPGR